MANLALHRGCHYGKFSAMKLSEYLALNKLTATDFAEKSGMAVSTVTRAIRGERQPTWTTLTKIRAATNGKVSANDFWPEPEVMQ